MREPDFSIEWIDAGKEPSCAPDPRFPDGIDLNVAGASTMHCTTALPYPARRIGVYLVVCRRCGKRAMITTAGRPDDPRSVRIACKVYQNHSEEA